MKILKEIYFHIKGEPTMDESPINSTKQNYVRANVHYDKGGYNMFSYKMVPRGYYISIHKVGRGKDQAGIWESHEIFQPDGECRLLFEVARQTKKMDQKAIELFDSNIWARLKVLYPDLVLEVETEQ